MYTLLGVPNSEVVDTLSVGFSTLFNVSTIIIFIIMFAFRQCIVHVPFRHESNCNSLSPSVL